MDLKRENSGALGGMTHNVYANDVADVMDLLSRWGPALHAAAVNKDTI